ncbi:mono-functional DNA-alkylating methyl methanesulfonate N-term-domain-containing protein [Scheffersomyces amazonensis]|uniref:mono-functional DNA-alkylating methyl methanesulfonate N-term-domain-containing protein n=1 Tax=Scheffersomyces amazonensis TaxID=1078765 RepID=UPI00315D6919
MRCKPFGGFCSTLYSSIGIKTGEQGVNENEDITFAKRTLASSPIIENIIPEFRVNIRKPFKGVSSASFNDDDYQVLIPNEMDSQLDAFSDDESDNEIFPQNQNQNQTPSTSATTTTSTTSTTTSTKIRSVQILVKLRSLLINGIEFTTKSEIRSSCVIPGIQTHGGEDSLLISLKSGFILLIRLYYIPRQYMDSDYIHQTNSPVIHTGNSIFKPFVVQWWNMNMSINDYLLPSGCTLHSDKSGLSVVSTSASRAFRIYNVQVGNSGIILKKHFNVKINGIILHSCFANPFTNSNSNSITNSNNTNTNNTNTNTNTNTTNTQDIDHVTFLSLVFTDFRRLVIELCSWSTVEAITQSFKKTSLPLPNNFEIPILVISLGNNNSFLFINQSNLIIVSIQNILSADYSFATCESPWSPSEFPTNYYKSASISETESETVSDSKSDQVYISTDAGIVYKIMISNNRIISSSAIIRVADPISIFSLELCPKGFNFIYGSDSGGNKSLLIKHLSSLSTSDGTIKFSEPRLIKDYKNWSPLLDIEILNSFRPTKFNYISNQELWGISGLGKRCKISHFKYGYSAQRKSDTYEVLRKAHKLFEVSLDGEFYLVCTFPYQSVVLKYKNEWILTEVSDAKILPGATIYAGSIINDKEEEVLFQVSSNEMLLSDFYEELNRQVFTNKILYCDVYQKWVVLISEGERDGETVLELYKFKSDDEEEEDGGIVELIARHPLSSQPSTVKLLTLNNPHNLFIAVGTFDGNLELYEGPLLNYHRTIWLEHYNQYAKDDFIGEEMVIAHDIVEINNYLLIGSSQGHTLKFHINDKEELVCDYFLKIGTNPITFCINLDLNITFIVCKGLWMLNLYESQYPMRVYFDETYERSIFAVMPIPKNKVAEDSQIYFAAIREDGLSLCAVSTFIGPCVKQISIPEPVKRIRYLDYLSIFMILCKSKNPKNRLKFFDRKSMKLLNHQEVSGRHGSREISIFSKNEYPISCCIWSILRNGHYTKKVLIGCSVESDGGGGGGTTGSGSGSFKVLDISKRISNESESISVKVTELISFPFDNPITNIIQINNDIHFSSKNHICYTSYDLEEKRLKPVTILATLASEIISMDYKPKDQLFITTKFDSVYKLLYIGDGNKVTLKYISNDPYPNNFINQAQMGGKIVAGDQLHSSLSIIDYENDMYSSRVSFKVPSLPRVYEASFRCVWMPTTTTTTTTTNNNNTILIIGVNGEIGYLSLLNRNGLQYTTLKNKLGITTSIEEEIKKLDRPFFNKLSGTGLLSLNKPAFDYKGNSGKFIDYDLQEISTKCTIEFCI